MVFIGAHSHQQQQSRATQAHRQHPLRYGNGTRNPSTLADPYRLFCVYLGPDNFVKGCTNAVADDTQDEEHGQSSDLPILHSRAHCVSISPRFTEIIVPQSLPAMDSTRPRSTRIQWCILCRPK